MNEQDQQALIDQRAAGYADGQRSAEQQLTALRAQIRDLVEQMRERVERDGPIGEKNEIEEWADELSSLLSTLTEETTP